MYGSCYPTDLSFRRKNLQTKQSYFPCDQVKNFLVLPTGNCYLLFVKKCTNMMIFNGKKDCWVSEQLSICTNKEIFDFLKKIENGWSAGTFLKMPHFRALLIPPEQLKWFFQPILLTCSFRCYSLWNQSIFSKKIFREK